MSVKLMVRVMEEVEVSRPEQAVLLAMAEHANDDGTSCRPSVDRIAWKGGYKPRAVESILRGLQEQKILIEVAPANRRGRSAEYEIHLEHAPAKPTFDEWREEHGKHRELERRRAKVQSDVPKAQSDVPKVQSDVPKVQSDVPKAQSDVPKAQSDVPKAQSDVPTGRETAPEPSGEPKEEPLHPACRPDGYRPPSADEISKLFYECLVEVRARSDTPEARWRPVPTRGRLSRRALGGEVAAALKGGQDAVLVARAVRRRALRWDDYAMDLGSAIGDVIDGKPWDLDGRTKLANSEAPAVPAVPAVPAPDPDLEASRVWESVLKGAAEEIESSSLAVWFEDTVPTRLEEGLLTLDVPNQFAKEYIERRFKSLLLTQLQEQLGGSATIEVHDRSCTVQAPPPTPTEPNISRLSPTSDQGAGGPGGQVNGLPPTPAHTDL